MNNAKLNTQINEACSKLSAYTFNYPIIDWDVWNTISDCNKRGRRRRFIQSITKDILTCLLANLSVR